MGGPAEGRCRFAACKNSLRRSARVPSAPLTKRGLASPPKALANSIASVIATLMGVSLPTKTAYQPPVDTQHLSGDIGGRVGHKKRYDVGNVLDGAKPAQRG